MGQKKEDNRERDFLMRILLISDHADPLAEIGAKEAGGQNIYVLYLAKFLSRLGLGVDIYTRWDRKNKKEVINLNGHLRVIRVKAGPKRYIPRDSFLGVKDEFATNVLKRIKKEKIDYDLIHTNYWFSGLIGLKIKRKIRVPLVHVYHSIGQIRFRTLKKHKDQKNDYVFFQKRLKAEREIAEKADTIIATSPVEKRILINLFKIDKNKIKVIPIGVDTKIFKPGRSNRIRKSFKISKSKKVILYVGRIEWRKGIGTLLYAFHKVLSRYPNTKLYIVGGGKSKLATNLEKAEKERLKNIIQELGLRSKVFFTGPKRQKSLFRYYSVADVCVVPSYYEPFGIVPLEAMACGTPVVASKTGGLSYTVKNNITGCLAEPRDCLDLANKISLVLKNKKSFYRDDCLKRIRNNFEWEKISQKYKTFFINFLKKR